MSQLDERKLMSKDEYVYKASRKCLREVVFMEDAYSPGDVQHFTAGVEATDVTDASDIFKEQMSEVCGDDWVMMSATLIKVFPPNHVDNPRRIMEGLDDDEVEDL